MKQIIEQTKAKMTAALEHLKTEFKNIRTGRANPGMLDHVTVDVYGSLMRVKDIAAITVPESRLILITPFDQTNTKAIGKAIERADIGLTPIVDGNVVRIKIAPMDDSMRKEMIKLCHKRCEEAKVGIRNIRRDSNEIGRKKKADGDLAEDLLKIQELTDKSCKEADELSVKKEKEISTI